MAPPPLYLAAVTQLSFASLKIKRRDVKINEEEEEECGVD